MPLYLNQAGRDLVGIDDFEQFKPTPDQKRLDISKVANQPYSRVQLAQAIDELLSLLKA